MRLCGVSFFDFTAVGLYPFISNDGELDETTRVSSLTYRT